MSPNELKNRRGSFDKVEDDGIVRVFKDKVTEFSMSKEYGLHYYVDKMCEDSWRWQKNNPNGYDE